MAPGVIAMRVGVPFALTEPSMGAVWWSVAGSGLAVTVGGVVMTELRIGTSEATAVVTPMRARGGPGVVRRF